MKTCPQCKSEFTGGEVFCPNDGSRLGSNTGSVAAAQGPADRLVGTLLADRYRVVRKIGEGGMGLVYEAVHTGLDKPVALKILRDDFSGRADVVERFKQEARGASRIGSDHIVDISDFGVTPSGASFFAMELLEGEDLATVLEREGCVPLQRAADILLQCSKALQAAHGKGIIHRDMKPENVFLTTREDRADFVKLVDFGIAKMSDVEVTGAPGRKLTKTGMIFGTPEYMSPEQAAGKPLDHRVDIYALSVMLFEMLTGRVPFVGDSFMGILTQHMFDEPPTLAEACPDLAVGPAIEAFVARGLAKDPDARFASCDEFARALRAALEGRAVEDAAFGTKPLDVSAVPATSQAAATAVRPPASAEDLARAEAVTDPDPALPLPTGASVATALPSPSTHGHRASRSQASPSSPARLGVLLAVLGTVGGAGAWFFGPWSGPSDAPPSASMVPDSVRPADRPPPFAEGAHVPAERTRSEVARAAVPAAVDAPADGPADAGPARVSISVATSPEGARVEVLGRGEVCAASPCSFETSVGVPISLRATLGRAEATAEVTPTANTVLSLEMRAPRTAGRSSEREPSSPRQRGVGGLRGLKIPEYARRPR